MLLQTSNRTFGFRNKDLREELVEYWKTAKIAYELRKIGERGAIKKLKNTHYYRLTEEEYTWIFSSFFYYEHLIKPLNSTYCNKQELENFGNHSKTEKAYDEIKNQITYIMKAFGLTA